MEDQKFDIWAMVELFGHSRIAGKCSERNIGGAAFLQIDVPETNRNPAFTRLINPSAVYAINPVTEDVARKFAEQLQVAPIKSWDIHEFIEKAQQHKQLEATEEEEEFGV